MGLLLVWYSAVNMYHKSSSKRSPASGTGNVSEPGLMSYWGSAQSRVCIDQCVSTIRTVGTPVFVCLCSSCYHVTGRRAVQFVRLML